MKYLILFVAALFFISCTHKKPDSPVVKIHIDPLNISSVFIEDIATEISTIDFGRDTDRINSPTKLFVTDSSVIIADRSLATLFIYDKQGVLRKRIEARGRSKEGLLDMRDIIYDAAQKQIEILDLGTQKIFIYTSGGRFKKTINILNSMALGFAFAKADNIYVTLAPPGKRNRIMKRLSVYEKTGDMISFHISQLDMLPLVNDVDIDFPHLFDNYKDSIYYLPLLDDKIYRIGLNDPVPAYQIDPPQENRITDELKKEGTAKDHFAYWNKAKDYKVIYNTNSLFVTDKWVSFRYDFQAMGNPRNVFYSKKTGKVLQATEFKSRKDPSFKSRSPILAKYGDQFIIASLIIDPAQKISPLVANPQYKNTVLSGCKFRLKLFKLKDF